MIIFLYGQDSYRSKRKLEEIIAHYKEIRKSGVSLVQLDVGQAEFAEFFSQLKVSSMFAEKKLVILKNLFSNKAFQEDFLREIEALESLKDIIIVYEKEAPDQRLKIFKALKQRCKCQEFSLLDQKQLKQWVVKELEKYHAKCNLDSIGLLLRYVGNDLWRLENEIKKLVAFKNGSAIKKEDVELLVKPAVETDIFKTIDAVAQKNRVHAFELLHKHLDNGDNPLYILSMVAYQCRNLLTVKELAEQGMMYASIIKKSGLHPFVVKKNYFQCSQFSFSELKTMYQHIFHTDLNIKTGKTEPETALDILVSKM